MTPLDDSAMVSFHSLSTDSEAAIGVFDSGLGGLDIAASIARLLPHEHLVYLGDTARVPYGTRSPQTVRQYTLEAAQFLIKEKKIKAIVIACNTASAYSMSLIEQAQQHNALVFGMIDAGVQATQHLSAHPLLVLATTGTIRSGVYQKALQKHFNQQHIFTLACPMFVPLVEAGWSQKDICIDIIKEQLKDLPLQLAMRDQSNVEQAWKACQNIQSVLLGCTHYPLLKNYLSIAFEEWLGHSIHIVDGAEYVAQQLKKALEANDLLNTTINTQRSFFTTDQPEHVHAIATRFWQSRIGEALPPLRWIKI